MDSQDQSQAGGGVAVHAPGPWTIRATDTAFYIMAGKVHVLSTSWNSYGSPIYPSKAVALVTATIAMAAPDLLEALIASQQIERICGELQEALAAEHTDTSADRCRALLEEIVTIRRQTHAAIAAALGQ